MDQSSLLAEYVRTRDPLLFQELTVQYQPMVQRICRRQLDNDSDAQEATQEVFRALLVHAEDIRSNLGGWLYKTSLNMSRATLRSNLSRSEREHAKAVPLDQTDHSNHSSEMTEVVAVCLEALESATQELLVNHFVRKKSQASIAQELGISQSTVSRRIEIARSKLRYQLEQHGVHVSIAAMMVTLGNQPATATTTQGTIAVGAPRAGQFVTGISRRVAAIAGFCNKLWVMGFAASLLLLTTTTGVYLSTNVSRFELANYELTTHERVNRNLSVYPGRVGGIVRVQTVTQYGEKRPRQEEDLVDTKVLVVSEIHSVQLYGQETKKLDQRDSYIIPDGWSIGNEFTNPGSPSKTVVLKNSADEQYGLFVAREERLLPVASYEDGFLYFYGAAAYESGRVVFSALHENDPPGMNVAGVYVWDGQSLRTLIRPGDTYDSKRVARAFLCRGPLGANEGMRLAVDFGPEVVHPLIISAQSNDVP